MTTQINLPPGMTIVDALGLAAKRLTQLDSYLKNRECTYLKFSLSPLDQETAVMQHDGTGKFNRNDAACIWAYEARVIPIDVCFAMIDHLAAQNGWTKHEDIPPHYLRLYTRLPVSIG